MCKKLWFTIIFLIFPISAPAKNYWQGTIGGTGGAHFQKIISSHEHICGIYVRHGNRVDAIQLKICDNSGNSYLSQRYGGSGGSESFFPVYSDEYISGTVVYSNQRDENTRIYGLKFIKNKIGSISKATEVESPLYGSATTTPTFYNGKIYNSQDPLFFMTPGIIGIWGKAQSELDSLGVIFSETQLANNKNSPWVGAAGGNDGIFVNNFTIEGAICGIDIRHGSRIDALRFKDCKSDGSHIYSPWQGGSGGSQSTFSLQENEYIKSINGSLINRNNEVVLSSIYFVTNMRNSPVYGVATTDTFNIEIPENISPRMIVTRSTNEINSLQLSN